jgi:hypothetical protein
MAVALDAAATAAEQSLRLYVASSRETPGARLGFRSSQEPRALVRTVIMVERSRVEEAIDERFRLWFLRFRYLRDPGSAFGMRRVAAADRRPRGPLHTLRVECARTQIIRLR